MTENPEHTAPEKVQGADDWKMPSITIAAIVALIAATMIGERTTSGKIFKAIDESRACPKSVKDSIAEHYSDSARVASPLHVREMFNDKLAECGAKFGIMQMDAVHGCVDDARKEVETCLDALKKIESDYGNN